MLEMNTAEKISQSKPIDDAMPEEVGIEVDFQPIKEFWSIAMLMSQFPSGIADGNTTTTPY